MKRTYLQIVYSGIIMFGLISGLTLSAFAGVTSVNHHTDNTPYIIPLEEMSVARNITLIGPTGAAGNGPVTFLPGQSITAGNLLKVSFSGALFSGDAVRVCQKVNDSVGNQLGQASPIHTPYSYFVLTGNVGAGNILYLTTDSGCSNTGAGSSFIVQLLPTLIPSIATVDMSILSAGGITIDVSSPAILAEIVAAANYSLYVSKSGTGNGTVTSSPYGINCGSDCDQAYYDGTIVKLTAAPSTGSYFAGWTGDCISQALNCKVTMDAAKHVTATFTSGTPPENTWAKTYGYGDSKYPRLF